MTNVLKWIREGDNWDSSLILVKVHSQQFRPDFGGTSSTWWFLCEFRENKCES